jgi:hypothetical protein
MKRLNRALFPALVLAGCNPYFQRSGEYMAGTVDPVNFPPPYLGGGSPKKGGGVFKPSVAWAAGTQVSYYPFPATAGQTALFAMNKGAIVIGNKATPTPPAYVFDPPFPSKQQCVPPHDYVFNQWQDVVRYDEQGSIFTALPTANYQLGALPTFSYIPVVAETVVTSNGEGCQSIKSASGLAASSGTTVQAQLMTDTSGKPTLDPNTNNPTAMPDGKFLAWAIVDPGAEVDPIDPSTGWGPQKWGWYDHYLTAYLDGGYVPTAPGTITAADGSTKPVTTATPQTIYVPLGKDKLGATAPAAATGKLGSKYDVIDAARGTPNYSPVCLVMTFTEEDWKKPASSSDQIDKSTLKPATAATSATPFIYCLQLQP